jgi:hypothetical protein
MRTQPQFLLMRTQPEISCRFSGRSDSSPGEPSLTRVFISLALERSRASLSSGQPCEHRNQKQLTRNPKKSRKDLYCTHEAHSFGNIRNECKASLQEYCEEFSAVSTSSDRTTKVFFFADHFGNDGLSFYPLSKMMYPQPIPMAKPSGT